MGTSKLQEATKDRLRLLFAGRNVIENAHPDWLINPITGRRLELDFFSPDNKFAVEVQGKQHLKFSPGMHRTEQDFIDQQERDRIKKELCERRGLMLYEVFCPADIDKLVEDIAAKANALAAYLYERNSVIKLLSYQAARLFIESRHRRPDNDTMARLAENMTELAVQYNIPLKSIRADFTIRKVEIAFMGRQIVKVMEYGKPRDYCKSSRGPIMGIEDDQLLVRMAYRQRGEDRFIDAHFSPVTGYQIPIAPIGWRIMPHTIPEEIRERYGTQLITHDDWDYAPLGQPDPARKGIR